MELNRSRLNWGVFLVVLGAIPLAYHQGAISQSSLADAWQLWPLIIVGIGIGLVLRRTPAYFVGGLVVAACFGLVLGSLFAVGPQFNCGGGGSNTTTISRDGTFQGAADVTLELQCGSATVRTSGDNQWHVAASNSNGRSADVSSEANSLSVRSGQRNTWWPGRGNDSWDVALPANQPIGLSVSVDAGDAHLSLAGANLTSVSLSLNAGSFHADLSGAHMSDLSVSTNVGSMSLILDGSSNVSGSISTNVGSLEMCVPSQLGLRLRSSESLASTNYAAAGLVRNGDAWETPGFDTAAAKADFSVSTSVGSLTLNPSGGCK